MTAERKAGTRRPRATGAAARSGPAAPPRPARAWASALAWMAVIYAVSDVPGLGILRLAYTAGAWLGLAVPPPPPPGGGGPAESVLRKLAHLAAFAVLGWLLARAAHLTPATRRRAWAWAFLMGLAYAAFDEWHQSWVPDRAGRLVDVVVDAAGVGLGILWYRRRPAR